MKFPSIYSSRRTNRLGRLGRLGRPNRPVYYAHSKQNYGSRIESEDRQWIETQGFHCLCPNRDIGESPIDVYLAAVQFCQGVVVRPLSHGMKRSRRIGLGVFREVSIALAHNRWIIARVGPQTNSRSVMVVGLRCDNPTDWTDYGELLISQYGNANWEPI